jgi:HemY protein
VGRLFLVALLALVAGVGIVALIETEPGYLLIAYGGYTVETSFWVGIVLIATAVLTLYALLRFLHRLIASPASVLSWASERRLRQSSRLTSRGLINFIEGNWSRARRQLLRGARFSEAPLLNYLIAARASYRLQDNDAMRQHLAAAANSDLEAGVAVDLTQAELQLHAGQFGDALATLTRAGENARRHPYVLHLLCRAQEGLGDAEAVVALLPELRRHRLRSAKEVDTLEDRVHRALLDEAVVDEDGDALQARWKKMPQRLRDDPVLRLRYYDGLLACGEAALVEKTVLKSLRRDWDADMVALFGRIPRDGGAQKALSTAEGWLKQRPEDPDLLLCLGRIALQERLWQKARDYLERSHKLRPSEEACLELGRLLAAAGEHAAAAQAFYTGVQLRGAPLPELPQPDDVLPGHHRLESAE